MPRCAVALSSMPSFSFKRKQKIILRLQLVPLICNHKHLNSSLVISPTWEMHFTHRLIGYWSFAYFLRQDRSSKRFPYCSRVGDVCVYIRKIFSYHSVKTWQQSFPIVRILRQTLRILRQTSFIPRHPLRQYFANTPTMDHQHRHTRSLIECLAPIRSIIRQTKQTSSLWLYPFHTGYLLIGSAYPIGFMDPSYWSNMVNPVCQPGILTYRSPYYSLRVFDAVEALGQLGEHFELHSNRLGLMYSAAYDLCNISGVAKVLMCPLDKCSRLCIRCMCSKVCIHSSSPDSVVFKPSRFTVRTL